MTCLKRLFGICIIVQKIWWHVSIYIYMYALHTTCTVIFEKISRTCSTKSWLKTPVGNLVSFRFNRISCMRKPSNSPGKRRSALENNRHRNDLWSPFKTPKKEWITTRHTCHLLTCPPGHSKVFDDFDGRMEKTHCFVELLYSRVSSIIHLGVSEQRFPTLKLCFASNKDVVTFFKYHHDTVAGQYPAPVGMVPNTGEFNHVQGISAKSRWSAFAAKRL